MRDLDFQSLFEALPSPHMVLDRDLNLVAVNVAYEAAVMRRRDELIGGNLFALFPNDGPSGARLRQSLLRVFKTGEPDTIAYIPYEIPRPEEAGGGLEVRYWTAVHTPIVGDGGDVAFVVQNTVDVTELALLQEAASFPFRTLSGEVELIQRAREAERAHRQTLSENADFKRLFQESPGMTVVLQGAEHSVTFANDAFVAFIGGRHLVGHRLRDALPEIGDQGMLERFDEVYRGGVAAIGEGVRIAISRFEGEAPIECYIDFSFQPIRNVAGSVTGVFIQCMDRTEHFLALQRQRLLLDELNHRVKNTLSTVQSIARQSFGSLRAAAAQRKFEARIKALSKAHDVLSEGHWETVKLSALLGQELAAFETGRVAVEGPEIDLNPKAAIALAMVFHELASNAAKHGALASDVGLLQVAWTRSRRDVDRHLLCLIWKESGRPTPAARSDGSGFGSRMLERLIQGELDGELDLDLQADGLMCRFEVSMSEVEHRVRTAAY